MVAVRSFDGPEGAKESFLYIEAASDADFSGQLQSVVDRYASAQREAGLDPTSAVFYRIFLSDVLNQAAVVRQSAASISLPMLRVRGVYP